MTARACRTCGCEKYDHFARVSGFNLGRCRQCSLVQITDDLAAVDLKAYYDSAFFENVYEWQKEGKGRKVAYEKFTYRLEEIEALRPDKGSILDVGCAYGFFLDVARSRGWCTEGVELGDHAVQYARGKLGLRVHHANVLDVRLPPQTFDVVTLWDVVEHLDDPISVLMHLRRSMKNNALLVFNTPDVDSYVRKVQGLRWRNFIPPIHVTYFGQRAAAHLLRRTGFRLINNTVALPRERLLQKLRLFGFLKAIRLSDKMLVFAERAD